jgi:hypothetical protein
VYVQRKDKCRRDTLHNLITLCSACHASVHGRYFLSGDDIFKESSEVYLSLRFLHYWPDRLEVSPASGCDLLTGIQQVRLAVHGKTTVSHAEWSGAAPLPQRFLGE